MFFSADGKQSQDKQGSNFMAMLALVQPGPITAAALIAEIRRAFPGYREEMKKATDDADTGHGPTLIMMGKDVLTVIPVDRPMPPDAMDFAAGRTTMFWPNAKQELVRHQGHVIVSKMLSGLGNKTNLEQARDVAMACAAISSIVPTIGVYWSAAEMVWPASVFREAAAELMKGRVPIEAWLHLGFMRVRADSRPNAIACITTGLQPFIGREIEVWPTTLEPAQIAERLYGLGRYLIDKGQILKDGETVGISQTEKFRVALAPQGQRPGIPVIQLKLELPDQTAGWRATKPAEPAATPGFTGGFGRRTTPVKPH
jgi:hypothetical protein